MTEDPKGAVPLPPQETTTPLGQLRYSDDDGTMVWIGDKWLKVSDGNLCRALSVPYDYPAEKVVRIIMEDNRG